MRVQFVLYYNPKYYLTHPGKLVRDIRDNLRWASQRVFRGWDDRVSWSIDGHLCDLLPQWLRQTKNNLHGFPMSLVRDSDWIDNDYNLSEEAAYERELEWKDILETIALGFEAGARIVDHSEKDDDRKIFDKGMHLLHKHFFDLWD